MIIERSRTVKTMEYEGEMPFVQAGGVERERERERERNGVRQ